MSRRFRYYEGWGVELPNDTETHGVAVNKAHRTRNSAKEPGVIQELAILEYIALNYEKERTLKNALVSITYKK